MAEFDPFDTATIRHGVLESWRLSATRLAEDAASESDLVEIGYRDRLLTELAANAADAAVDRDGELAIWATPDNLLHVANTGAPLSGSGVAALAALRVSAKTAGPDSSTRSSVGRFGVGFSSVAAVGVEVAIRSARGGVVFGTRRTADALADAGIPAGERVPMLRLPWPDPVSPTAGFDTEVVIELRPGLNAADLVAAMDAQVETLLLELTALRAITCGSRRVERTVTTADGVDTVVVGERSWVGVRTPHARWLMPGTPTRPRPLHGEVLHAPTRTDVELTLPALCIADIALTPDRRGLHPDADIAGVATGYHHLALALDPVERLAVVPTPGFAAGRVDDALRTAVLDDLIGSRWLPTADDSLAQPDRAVVLAGLTESLGALLADVLDGLVHPSLSDTASLPALRSLRVEQITLADVVERLTGMTREPAWWSSLYDALTPLIVDDRAAGEIGAIPVPRSDGRVSIGARGLVIADAHETTSDDAPGVAISWLPTVHPDAAHPLLERLGARRMTVGEIVDDPALRAAIDTADDDAVTEEVLALLATDPHAPVPEWLGGLLVPDTDDELRPADELLLPDSPLASVLAPDSPFGIVDAATVARHGPEVLRRIGIGWGFTLIADELPAGPDHDLPDENRWWDSLDTEPQQMTAVRDLDLVDSDRWHRALSLLVDDPTIAATLTDRTGYTAWWLRTFAEIDGRPLGHLRAPDDVDLTGLLDPIDHPDADRFAGALAGATIESDDHAALVLRHLGDPDRAIAPGVAAHAHSALMLAHRRRIIDLDRLDAPTAVRTLAGTTSDTALVLDRPWMLQVLDPAETVICAPPIDAGAAAGLATVLDIPTASEELRTEIVDHDAVTTTWRDSPTALADAITRGAPAASGTVVIHDRLRIEVRRGERRRLVDVTWWVDDTGIHHLLAPAPTTPTTPKA
ncbi:sacsin N-terminal ATP-binding-like domain-containing protein [Williamsia phyllosphaerae]|uniref:Molecular chaperone Hsp90 n=1 Tax=Williamsia phyllosphaerae TaxID=885042 RepID=A0ABQ1V3Z3_9NOCA|nr:ATP-binding protein [Williamsia phyllosphaerae]GGF36299.1 molecular chaperone Hsp90 [Williamsia phyllosphaerae]